MPQHKSLITLFLSVLCALLVVVAVVVVFIFLLFLLSLLQHRHTLHFHYCLCCHYIDSRLFFPRSSSLCLPASFAPSHFKTETDIIYSVYTCVVYYSFFHFHHRFSLCGISFSLTLSLSNT